MNITVIGAGNSGLAMAAHLALEGNKVVLWNRSKDPISKLRNTRTIYCKGMISDAVQIDLVTDNIEDALAKSEVILITTPANSHKYLAELIAKNLKKEALIVLNPGRTFGALEFNEIFKQNNKIKISLAETQTIIYTCRKISEDTVNIITIKSGVLISTFDANENERIIKRLPKCLQGYYKPATSMIETSIGNVGMILHCAPLLLNTGWTECKTSIYKYYYDGITPSIANLLEKLDAERIQVSKKLGFEVETTKEWLMRTYNVKGQNLYECIQNNQAYKTIDAPKSLNHRYIYEDVPCGLVPLEAIGKILGLKMEYTSLIIDLAISLTDIDYRNIGRNLSNICKDKDLRQLFKRRTT
ncbi:opine dehydrogenase [Anaerobranca californiensis DSM 14826]|jgi:opine dehydrogenase|uniref:Opine dehydrogenase n=1 Tax=Anaerobranca californiensis DSM 14826 TaxID=1120989 RepID=A0A1M6NAJ3_9FIRM|nr:NAD/NADP-dependent octopine/nopaline dehydrogenase family protein [Anaerobranca californiensis]SHJ92729.1 opine dehydrogenase [Anaerobranca californiensis DSM 14826]